MTEEGPRRLHKRRRTRWMVVGTATVVALGVGTAVILTRVGSGSAVAAPQGPAKVDTAKVVKTDLADKKSESGKLGYGIETTLPGRKPGTITGLPAIGDQFDRGKSVYKVDAKPVPLFYGDIPMYRPVGPGATNGPDVKLIEENLKAMGFGGFGNPDEKFTDATANAIKKWQKQLKVDQNGTVAIGDVVIAPGPLRVSTLVASLGSEGTTGVLKYTGVNRGVTVKIKAEQRDNAKPGSKVTVSVGGAQTTGTVKEVTLAPPDNNNQGMPGGEQDTKFDVSISLDDPAAVTAPDASSVDVRFTVQSHKGVLAVPVGALLALSEGGYALEVVEGSARRLIPVTTGLFADGKVEVSGPDVREGMQVVTTS